MATTTNRPVPAKSLAGTVTAVALIWTGLRPRPKTTTSHACKRDRDERALVA